MLVLVLRAVFILALMGVAMVFLSQGEADSGGSAFFTALSLHKDLALLVCSGLALVIIAIDIFIPRKTLSAISGLFFGLIVGMVAAFGLSLIVDLMVEAFFPQLRTPVYAEVAVQEIEEVPELPIQPEKIVQLLPGKRPVRVTDPVRL